jgi:outer membrane receptor protein involved in Fe transport
MELATLGGLVDVTDILQESTIAANAPQLNNMFTGFTTTGGPGINSVDLRGLGTGKTLVLLNGRRLNAAGTRGTVSSVDLNTIPSSIIQRVEILKDGASSVYGSDAVAGVVNIITKKGADGISGSVSTNVPFDGGGEITTADIAIGISDDDSSFMFGIDYLERQALIYGDRDWMACKEELYYDPDTGEDISMIDPRTGENKCWGFPNNYIINYGDYYDTGTSSRSIWDPQDGSTDTSDPANWRIGSLGERDFSNPLDQQQTAISPVRRISAFSFGNWDIDAFGEGTQGYYEFMYNNRRSNQTNLRQIFPWVNDSPFSPFVNAGGWSWDRPLLPFLYKSEQEVNWLRTVAGLSGNLGERWSYDVSVGYGRSHGTYSSPQFGIDRIVNSLDLVEVAPGEYDCAVNYAYDSVDNGGASTGCVPFNPFEIMANGQIWPQEVLDYLTTMEVGETTFSQKMVMGYVTGELFEMPAGTVGAVFGVEAREESINDTPSPGAVNGNLWGFTSSGITKGTDRVKEIFTEIEIPLLADAPGFEELTFSAAARWSDYDTAGDDTTYKAGLNWQIIDAVRLRSSFGTSFRAPSLYESFLGGQTAFSSAFDPCENYGEDLNPGEPTYENCDAEIGDPDFSGYTETPRIIRYGNAGRLQPETSESFTVGLVFQFEAIDLSLAIDYFDFDISDEITTYGASSILSQCYSLPTDQFRQPNTICDFITPRDPITGNIEEINDSYFNINSKKQDGFDLTVRYNFEIGAVDFTADLRFTKIENFTVDLFGGEVDDYNGTIGYAESNGQFDLQANIRDWTLYYGLDFIEGQEDYTWFGYDPATSIYLLSVDDVYYHDLAARYNGDGWSAQLGVQNVADKNPPSVSDWDAPWGGNAAYNTGYDQRGRTFFVNLTKGF